MKHIKNIVTGGLPIDEAQGALVMIHGRGADAQGILSIATHLEVSGLALIAPQATNHTWYPYSFMADRVQNEPWLTSALDMLATVEQDIIAAGIPADKIYFLGFSQGACLALEYVSRHAKRYGGVIALTGGLIGPELDSNHYVGDFNSTPIFISTGEPDPHVPLSRVRETEAQLQKMNANVQLEIYPGRPHTITLEELQLANQHIF